MSTATADDSILADCLNASQQGINRYCRRFFEQTTGTYYYREDDIVTLPIGSQWRAAGGSYNVKSWDIWPDRQQARVYGHTVLDLKRDLLSVTTLTNGEGSVITSTGYWLEPRNSTGAYRHIRLKTSESWIFNTDGEITVAGNWGYTTAPDDLIQEVTKEYAAYLYRMRDNPIYDITANPELGIITVPKGIPAHLKMVLDKGGYVAATRVI